MGPEKLEKLKSTPGQLRTELAIHMLSGGGLKKEPVRDLHSVNEGNIYVMGQEEEKESNLDGYDVSPALHPYIISTPKADEETYDPHALWRVLKKEPVKDLHSVNKENPSVT